MPDGEFNAIKPIGFLAGPTASGKSSLAISIARNHGLAIVSADSMQVYRGMTIGTGAVTQEEANGVPHHLVGVSDPSVDFFAARFVEAAHTAINLEWREHRRRCLVVGGTGMWIQSLREGLIGGPGRDETIRERHRQIIESEGRGRLHEMLAKVDPAAAARLFPADFVRVARALEVWELTGRTMTDWLEEDRLRREALGPLPPLVVLNPPREQLFTKIDARVGQMIEAGWLDEARELHRLNLPESSPARKALGYRELFRVIDGEVSLDEAVENIRKETRKFAKRQVTWFRAQRDVTWLAPPYAEAEEALGLGKNSAAPE